VNERDVAAAVYEAMVCHGGEPPGFSPFVRSTARLGQEHRTWEDQTLRAGDALFVELAGCVRRYHAAMGRLIYISGAPAAAQVMARVCLEAFAAAAAALRPGARARDVYDAWQDRVDAAGLAHYRRHHCGYMIGIGFPPSWVGGNKVVGLRHDSDLQLEAGMVFHLMSWLMGTGRGNYFVSDTARVTADGCEVLTTVSQEMQVV
jgi:Xaa-Pro dipeptidase